MTTGLTVLVGTLLLEDITLLVVDTGGSVQQSEMPTALVLVVILDDVSVLITPLVEPCGVQAPNTKDTNIGNKRNAFFILFISPYLM